MSLHGQALRRRTAGIVVPCLCMLAALAAAAPCSAGEYTLLPQESHVTIHVGTAGLFGFLGHEHVVEAPLSGGRIVWDAAEPQRSEVHVEFDAARLAVVDPELDADKRARIQADMSGKVLEVERYPVISFSGGPLRIEGGSDAEGLRGSVTGTLSLHGVDARLDVPVELRVTAGELHARGTVSFKGSRFGIERVSAGAGTVKTRDLLELNFDVVARPGGSS